MRTSGVLRWAAVCGLAAAGVCMAQMVAITGAPPPPLPIGGVVLGTGITGIKGQPYSLVQKNTTIRTLADGTTITTVREEHKMRDAEGRERTETYFIRDGKQTLSNVHVMDPVARTTTTWFPNTKTANVMHFAEPKPLTPEEQARRAEILAKAKEARAARDAAGTNPATQHNDVEKLPPQNIAGVYAEGTRSSFVIPAGKEGNDRDIRVTSERWFSPDLKIELSATTEDPRLGKITMEVTDLQRIDPDPELFHVPAGYKVSDPKAAGNAAGLP